MSTLFVDTINEKTTGNGIYIPGHVLQVQSASTNANGNSSSTTFVASGLQVSITPKSTSSKIFITVSGGTMFVPSGKYVYGTIYRGSNNLGVSSTVGLMRNEAVGSNEYFPHAMQVLDTPATTSAITYEPYYRIDTAATFYWSYSTYGKLTITAMEIGG